jgi:hypothetical protein
MGIPIGIAFIGIGLVGIVGICIAAFMTVFP